MGGNICGGWGVNDSVGGVDIPRAEQPVRDAIAGLTEALEYIHSTCDDLERSFDSVLRPIPPMDCAKAVAKPAHSELHGIIDGLKDRAWALNSRLAGLAARSTL